MKLNELIEMARSVGAVNDLHLECHDSGSITWTNVFVLSAANMARLLVERNTNDKSV